MQKRPSLPAPTYVAIGRNAPPGGTGWTQHTRILISVKAKFSKNRTEQCDRLETARENRALAQRDELQLGRGIRDQQSLNAGPGHVLINPPPQPCMYEVRYEPNSGAIADVTSESELGQKRTKARQQLPPRRREPCCVGTIAAEHPTRRTQQYISGQIERLALAVTCVDHRFKEHGLRARSRSPSGPTHRAPRPHANRPGGSSDARQYNARQR
jgi:hypothetical protein